MQHEIMIYGFIGWDIDSVRVIEAVKEAERNRATSILVRIHSGGGEVFEGIAICTALKTAKIPVYVQVDGLAASMASVIAMCGKKISITRMGIMMIHKASGGAWGNEEDLRAAADQLKVVDATLADAYRIRTGKPLAEIQEMMTATTWLTAQEAVDQKFCDEIIDLEQAPAIDLPQNYAKMSPGEWQIHLKKFNAAAVAAAANTTPKITSQPLVMDNKLKMTLAIKLGLDTAASDDIILAATLGAIDERDQLRGAIAAHKTAEQAAQKATIAGILDKAQAENRITLAQRPEWESMLAKDFTNASKALASIMAPVSLMGTIVSTPANVTLPGGSDAKPIAEDRKGWKLTDWMKKDPTGLEDLEKNNPAAFALLK